MGGLQGPVAFALPSEILHYTQPERYWLWASWIWDPKTTGGALPLVLQKDADLAGAGMGETYEKVGRATAMVNAVGHAEVNCGWGEAAGVVAARAGNATGVATFLELPRPVSAS